MTADRADRWLRLATLRLLDPVAGVGQRALLQGGRPQQDGELIATVSRREGTARQVLADRGDRPARQQGEAPIRERSDLVVASVPTPEGPEYLREILAPGNTDEACNQRPGVTLSHDRAPFHSAGSYGSGDLLSRGFAHLPVSADVRIAPAPFAAQLSTYQSSDRLPC